MLNQELRVDCAILVFAVIGVFATAAQAVLWLEWGLSLTHSR
jgi:hypothetical protein